MSSAFSKPTTPKPAPPPFNLKKIDHVVIRCHDYNKMFEFYTDVLGCTVDKPEDIGRFGGALTHLRAGDCMIDLLSYDTNVLSEQGKAAVSKMHGGGDGVREKE